MIQYPETDTRLVMTIHLSRKILASAATCLAALACVSCLQQQEMAVPWGQDRLYTWEEIAAMEVESQEYRSQILHVALDATNVSLEKHSIHNGSQRKRRIRLHPKEQETLLMLLFQATYHPVKNDTRVHPSLPPTEWTELVLTDKGGKRLYHGSVDLCSARFVSKDGYALGAYLALDDESYRLWKSIIHREKATPTEQEHESATTSHRQAVQELHAMLRNCKTATITGCLNMAPACWKRELTPAETQELCTLLRKSKPLLFLGNIRGLRKYETAFHFYNADGESIGSFDVRDITDAASARNPEHCTSLESMYLPTRDYNRLQGLITRLQQ